MNWKNIVEDLEGNWSWNDAVFLKIYDERARDYKIYTVQRVEVDRNIGQILLVAGDKIDRFHLIPEEK